MSLGTWDPDANEAASHINIDQNQLDTFINWSDSNQLGRLEQLIPNDRSQVLAGLMQLQTQDWVASCQGRSAEELLALIRFFCIAENLPGWESGEKSPVIPLAKLLRKRGHKLDRELLVWIRSVNSNRFLPYGPLV